MSGGGASDTITSRYRRRPVSVRAAAIAPRGVLVLVHRRRLHVRFGHRSSGLAHRRDQPAVDLQVAAGDERRRVRAQERDRAARCRRRGPAAPCRRPTRPARTGVSSAIFSLIGWCVELEPTHPGVDQPGRHRHDPAAARAPRHRGALAQADHPPLGQPVGGPGIGLGAERATRNRLLEVVRARSSSTASIAGSNSPRCPAIDEMQTATLPGHDGGRNASSSARDRDEVDAQDLAPTRPSTARGPRSGRASAACRASPARHGRGAATNAGSARSPASALDARSRWPAAISSPTASRRVVRRRSVRSSTSTVGASARAQAAPIAPAAPVTTDDRGHAVAGAPVEPGAALGAADRGPLTARGAAGRRPRLAAVPGSRRQGEAGVGDAPLVRWSGASTGAACTRGARSGRRVRPAA